MCSDTQQKTEVNTEGTDVGSCFATDMEDGKMPVVVEFEQLVVMNGTNTELAFDSGDEWRTLEEGTGQSLKSARELCLSAGKLLMKADNGDVLFSSTLLGFDETSSTVDADD